MLAILDKAILASRYLLVVFHLGLALALAAFAVGFLRKLWSFASLALSGDATAQLIALLHLLDAALVASLVVMVAISSWDSLVSRLASQVDGGDMGWVARIDPGNLKIKLATALIAISSIHLLQIFMEIGSHDDRTVSWALAIHGMFLLGAVALGVLDRLTAAGKRSGNP
jgi:uncharacterized protein (TIGR00645 family)